MDLSEYQQGLVEQFSAVTGEDAETSQRILARAAWNIERAISLHFDGDPHPEPPLDDATFQTLLADTPLYASHNTSHTSLPGLAPGLGSASEPASDSGRVQRLRQPAPRVVLAPRSPNRLTLPMALLLSPLTLGYRSVLLVYRIIFYLVTYFPRKFCKPSPTKPLQQTRHRQELTPQQCATRFRREFAEQYADDAEREAEKQEVEREAEKQDVETEKQDVDTQNQDSEEQESHIATCGLEKRNQEGRSDKSLPRFYDGSMAQALDHASREATHLLILLISPLHDDTDHFARETLSPEVVALLNRPNMTVWGGNILDPEAYQVACQYGVTEFPFSALISRVPTRGSSGMHVLCRLTGRMTADAYLSAICGVLAECEPALQVVRAEKAARDAEKRLRDEQDAAYERSLQIDRQKAAEKREAARLAAEEAEQRAQKRREIARERRRRSAWRARARKRIRPEASSSGDDPQGCRVAIKLPDSVATQRVVRRFDGSATLRDLYTFVECCDGMDRWTSALLGDLDAELDADPDAELDADVDGPDDTDVDADDGHTFLFLVATLMPRRVLAADGDLLASVLGRSATLIVEEAD